MDFENKGVRNLLIDCDVGLDDAMAIMMLHKAHKDPESPINIIGIVCTNGNSSVENCCRNTRRVLNLLNETGIPIYKGSSESLVIPYTEKRFLVHGEDGLGDVFPKEFNETPFLSKENGISAMIRLAKEYKGNLRILAIGPLTNLALATRIDEEFPKNVKELYIMGGNIKGMGNVKSCAEFNFAWDPEAAYITLQAEFPTILIVPLETCRINNFTYEWRKEILSKLDTKETSFLDLVEDSHLEELCKSPRGYIPYDQIASAVVIEPNIIKKKQRVFCTVDLNGKYSRGMLVTDWATTPEREIFPNKNAEIVQAVDKNLLEKMLIWAAGGSKYK